MEIRHFFFYGTLMTSFLGHEKFLKSHVATVQNAWTKGQLYHLPAGYPSLLEGEGVVRGELIELRNMAHIIGYLDAIKGYHDKHYSGYYERVSRPIQVTEHQSILAYLYITPKEKAWEVQNIGTRVIEGDWVQFMTKSNFFSGYKDKHFLDFCDA